MIRSSGNRVSRSFAADRHGTAAVEFSLLLPVFCVLLVGVIDFGGVVYTKFRLNAAVSAGANYALVHASNVDSTSGPALATAMANIMGLNDSSASSTATVVVNNGPTATRSGGATTAGGTAANANQCFCPTLTGTTVTWGTAQTCGAACTGGGTAGKFVSIVAQQTYTPSFSNYHIVQNNTITSRAVVQAQ